MKMEQLDYIQSIKPSSDNLLVPTDSSLLSFSESLGNPDRSSIPDVEAIIRDALENLKRIERES